MPERPRQVQRYAPRGGCRDLFLATDPECLAVGPAGTGKTLAACYKLHLTALRHPGVRILMVRKVLEDLKTGALHTYTHGVQPELAGVVTFGGNRFYPAEFRYPNGSSILVVGMDKPGKVMSAEYDIVFANEATELTEADWQSLKSRLRNGALPYQQIIGDCNPSGPRHWLNQRCNRGQTRRITTMHRDNPAYWDHRANDWTPLGYAYVQENLAGLTGVERERLFAGKWAAAEGLVYPQFSPDVHVRAMDTTGWTPYLAADIGNKNPTCIGTAHLRGDGWLHINRELYRRNMTATDIITAIEAEADRCNPLAIYIDPSAKGYIDDLLRDGYPAEAAENDIIEGIQRVKGVLTNGFSIDPSCTNIIDEFGLYSYPEHPRVETDKPVKEHDHGMDMFKYLCMGVTQPADPLEVW